MLMAGIAPALAHGGFAGGGHSGGGGHAAAGTNSAGHAATAAASTSGTAAAASASAGTHNSVAANTAGLHGAGGGEYNAAPSTVAPWGSTTSAVLGFPGNSPTGAPQLQPSAQGLKNWPNYYQPSTPQGH
jgi:hypothetical protein